MHSSITEGKRLPIFFRFAFSSAIGLLALTTASVVDGIFLGRYVGEHALAAVNLLIPLLTFGFASVLMIAVGGAIQASHAFGEKKLEEANNSFNRSLFIAFIFSLLFLLFVRFSQTPIFFILSIPIELQSLVKSYLDILCFGFPFLFSAMVHYYFLRCGNQPNKASIGLVLGACSNIVLDIIFIAYLDWGVPGAALATLLSHGVQCFTLIYMMYRFKPFQWSFSFLSSIRHSYKKSYEALANGFSEFINEISAGLIIGIINFLALKHFGQAGVSAFAVLNYLMFVTLMLSYGLIDSLHVLVGENFGAKNYQRMFDFFKITAIFVISIGIFVILCVTLKFNALISLFLPQASKELSDLCWSLFVYMWPTFVFVGINISICAFLTAIGQVKASALISFFRSLFFPVFLLLAFGLCLNQENFLIALPLAETLTTIILVYVFTKHFKSLTTIKTSP